jgi:lipopolysaccharide assembly outer membrane protein LptD (OstA)
VKVFFKSIVFLFFCPFFHIVFLEGEDIHPENAKKVKFDRDGMHVEADHVILENQVVHASGSVHFTGENFYARCDEVQYDIKSQDMSALGIDMGIDGACISAEKANFSRNQIEVENAQIGINLSLEEAIPNLKAKKIT